MPKLFRHTQNGLLYLIECYKHFVFYSILSGMLFCTELAFAQNNENLTEMPLEDLLAKEVTTASKLAQQISDSPSAVSIVTAKDIKSYGYHTLADIIDSMRGLNTVTDHVYTYMSGRGFGRPGDYPGRVMLLIDGHQANDNLYNASYLGHDGLLDTELIERVEYVSGPGSVVYGNGAFYGIINVITKKGADYNSTQFALDAYSHNGYKGRITYGHALENGADILMSVSGLRSRGQDWYFNAFDTPATNFGIAENLDNEKNKRFFFKGHYQQWSLEAAYVDRKKDDPAAAYGTDFNAKPNSLQDTNAYLHLSYEDALSEHLKNVSKIYYGHYQYDAQNLSSGVLYHEDNIGRWWGAETKFVYTGFNQHQLVYGAEIRDDFQQDFIFPTAKVENSSYMASVYLQDEYRWSQQWALNAGLRGDYGGKNANNLSPRLALLYSPQENLEIKASYATAFRRANAFEKYYEDGSTQLANPDLKKEQVKAYELVVDYQPDAKSKLMGSLYYYKTEDAIQINALVLLPGFTQANNADAMFRTRGMDWEYERRFTPTSRIRANYAWQYSTQESRQWMVNSPKNLAKFNYAQDLFDQQLNLGLELQYVGKRLTEQRATLGSYSVVNLTMYNNTWFKNTTLSASVKNLLNRHYAVPAPDYSTPDRFEQDGARAWVQVTYDLK